ncbi:MAG: UDP-glucuronate decarboxylase [Woeseiaceae bacterium]|jgi:UDP-glucuronate decarboxylase
MVDGFRGKTILVTGATGLIGSRIIASLMELDGVYVIALSRNSEKLSNCFSRHLASGRFTSIEHDISLPLSIIASTIDYIFHAASPQESKIIKNHPLDVIMPNILGTVNCLDYLVRQGRDRDVEGRLILFSSVTVYGNNTDEDLTVTEMDTSITECIESNGAPYSQSKRMSEVIVQAYIKQFSINAVICRLSTVYGDTKYKTDTAFFEFINNAILRKDIHVRSAMLPRRDNIYIDDAVSGLLTIAVKGETGQSYNVSSNGELGGYLAVDEIAQIIANEANKQLEPNQKKISIIYDDIATEKRRPPGIILDNSKLKKLGWVLSTVISDGIVKTLYSCNLAKSND